MFTDNMRIGWNLGNTMDASDDALSYDDAPEKYETSWGCVTTRSEMIEKVIEEGFNVIRIPVTWNRHIGPAPSYTINKAWMKRVREIVDYAYSKGVYVILNTHHEPWQYPYYANMEATCEKLAAVWTQIGQEFQDYGERLILEGLNEPRKVGTEMEWNGGDEEGWDVENHYADTFVKTVRSLGGNNATRYLMVSGYAANSSDKALSHIVLPESENLIVSVHAYEPWDFALNTAGREDWKHDTAEIDRIMNTLNRLFISKGIPVIIGEFGAMNKNGNEEEREAWVEYYIKAAKENHIPCIWWDNSMVEGDGEKFGLIDRTTLEFHYPKVIRGIHKGLQEIMVKPSNPALQYMGRIDFSNPDAPEFVFACSFVKIKFKGTRISALLQNMKGYFDNYLGILIDGTLTKICLPEDRSISIIELASGLTDTEHELTLYKRMDACHYFKFFGFLLEENATLCQPTAMPSRRMEVFGDSVSAGEVSEAVEYCGKADPVHNGEYSNSFYSYSWMTARKLNAQLHDIAQGGASLMDDNGYFMAPQLRGMEHIFDHISYNLDLGEDTYWDFTKYTPNVVVVAIGQNDNHPEDYMKEDYNGEKAKNWRNRYEAFIGRLRTLYPKATIILATTILRHDPSWDHAIDDVAVRMKDSKIHHFLYSNNADGTDGHIRIPEADKMSDELSAYINSLGEEIWKD